MAAPFIISRRLTRAVAALPLPVAAHRALRTAVSNAEAQSEPEQVADYHERQAGVMNVVGGLLLVAALLLTNALHDVLGEGQPSPPWTRRLLRWQARPGACPSPRTERPMP